jgi:predicted transcriptional regulator
VNATPNAPKRPVLMSIRAPYADAILAKQKTAEFRLRPPDAGTEILIYRSGGDPGRRGIVGVFTAGDVVSGTAVDHFREVEHPGIGLAALESYAGGTTALVWRIEIAALLPFASVVPLRAVGLARAPQSWQYISVEQVAQAYLAVGRENAS